MLVSAIDGRMRFIDPVLKINKKADAIEEHIQKIDGVTSVKVSRLTGSLLVLFEKSTVPARTIQKSVKFQLKALRTQGNGPLTGKRARRYVKLVMLASIISSMGILFAGSEKWHYRIGTVFLSLLTLHLYQNKKRIFK